MSRESVDDLVAFLAVARQQSFTRAAAALGVSQPALSQTVRALEQRLGVRLLIRTTRSVSTTEAGERLLHAIGPHFDGIQDGLAALSELRDTPAGRLRITSVEHASQTILAPALAKLLPELPRHKHRDHQRLSPHGHCGRSLRCGHSPGRAGRPGHDRRAHRSGLRPNCCRGALVL